MNTTNYKTITFKEYTIKTLFNKYGIVDNNTNRFIVKCVFDDIKWIIYKDEAVACLRLGDKWGIVPYDRIRDYHCNFLT